MEQQRSYSLNAPSFKFYQPKSGEGNDLKINAYKGWLYICDVTRSVSKMTEIERRGGKRWDKPKKAEKSRDCGGGKF